MNPLSRPLAGTNVGGGTFWGLAQLLTGVNDFDEILALSGHGDNSNVRVLCGGKRISDAPSFSYPQPH